MPCSTHALQHTCLVALDFKYAQCTYILTFELIVHKKNYLKEAGFVPVDGASMGGGGGDWRSLPPTHLKEQHQFPEEQKQVKSQLADVVEGRMDWHLSHFPMTRL